MTPDDWLNSSCCLLGMLSGRSWSRYTSMTWDGLLHASVCLASSSVGRRTPLKLVYMRSESLTADGKQHKEVRENDAEPVSAGKSEQSRHRKNRFAANQAIRTQGRQERLGSSMNRSFVPFVRRVICVSSQFTRKRQYKSYEKSELSRCVQKRLCVANLDNSDFRNLGVDTGNTQVMVRHERQDSHTRSAKRNCTFMQCKGQGRTSYNSAAGLYDYNLARAQGSSQTGHEIL
jgi:hypothetical protein